MIVSPCDFQGVWRIEREIEDSLANASGQFTGSAEIAAKDEDWVYAESGLLKISSHPPMQAERKYIWRADAAGIDIFFEDKRFFHRLSLEPPHEARHWCDPDRYEVRYDLNTWPNWRSTWRVQGPRKDYVMRSSYTPAA